MSSRAVVTIHTQEDREKVARWAHQTNVGTVVEFRKKSRSTEQNAKLWAMLTEVSEQVDWYGSKLTPEDWKTVFSASLRKATIVPGIDTGTVVPLGLSTSNMTIEEMGDLIELITAFGAQRVPPVRFKDSPPETEDAAVPPASGADDELATSGLPSPEDAAVETAREATEAAASSNLFEEPELSAKDSLLLIECYSKLIGISKIENIDIPAKRSILEGAKNDWKQLLRPELHSQLASMVLSADAVIKGADRDKAIAEYAYFLGCTPEELGGGNG